MYRVNWFCRYRAQQFRVHRIIDSENFMIARVLLTCVVFFAVTCDVSGKIAADDPQPVAIRHWPGGGITIETNWGIHVGFGIDATIEEQLESTLDFKVGSLQSGESVVLSRAPNTASVASKRDDDLARSVLSIPELKTNHVLAIHGNDSHPTSIFVDGMALLFFSDTPGEEHFNKREAADAESDNVSQLPTAITIVGDKIDAAMCQKIADSYKPALMVVPRSITKVGDVDVQVVSHNTVAFSSVTGEPDKTKFVSLGDKTYEMSAELKELFAKKETACNASQEFFAELSVEQMNFKPDNGSHTPRWNPEHMMGRELLFFSQIYNAVDPMIPVMDLNPKQMPEDYEFAHPDWTGAEEAKQMQRVAAFTRRFAYLLDNMDLDRRANGSRIWTPRALLQQMERHYSEHTANVKKKMELPGWPEK